MLKKLEGFIKKNSVILGLVLFYAIFRTLLLTSLPMYSDESVYLDWAWRETHVPGYLFYSLYDAKPPLMIWAWGIAESILKNELLAGRLVSVASGFLVAFGLYKITGNIFSKRTAYLAFLLYTVTPIFFFYDRQVLFEAGVAAAGVWACYNLLKLVETERIKYAWFLGIVLGLGFFVKISAIIFLLAAFLILAVAGFKRKKSIYFKFAVIIITAFILTDFLLLIQPEFWKTIYDNRNTERFLTISEISHFPITTWISNIWGNFQIAFFFITPFIFATSIFGMFRSFQSKDFKVRIVIYFFFTAASLQLLFLRVAIQRYIDPFLPLLIVFASCAGIYLIDKYKEIGKATIAISVFIAAAICIFQAENPASYFVLGAKITPFVDRANYYDGITSGFGVDEPVKYLLGQINGRHVFVGTAVNSGTPESVFIVDYQPYPNIITGYMDSRMVEGDLSKVKCIKANVPVYFVARNEERAGFDKFLQKLKTFTNPYNKNVVTIYKLISPCEGPSITISIERT